MITPLQMGIILAAHTGCKQYDFNNKSTKVYKEQHLALEDLGLITYSDQNDNFILTEKGRVWLKAVLDLSFPVKVIRWEIPK
jgi:hypothetical protein